MKFLALILDALDVDNIFMFNFPNIQRRYREDHSDILGVSTLPHTALSNPMIWGGVENEDKFWVMKNANREHDEEWVSPSRYFDRDKGGAVDGASGFSREEDYADETFIWDDLDAAGYDARALQVPIVLPPYSYNVTDTLDESWFPDTQERQHGHIRKKPDLIIDQFEDGADFLATSIQMPDKWLHGVGEEEITEEWVIEEAPVLDRKVEQILSYCEDNGIEWAVLGDHGSPQPGAMKKSGYILPRHRRESVIISSMEDPPTYTEDIYPWMLETFDAEEAPAPSFGGGGEEKREEVRERLEALGYV